MGAPRLLGVRDPFSDAAYGADLPFNLVTGVDATGATPAQPAIQAALDTFYDLGIGANLEVGSGTFLFTGGLVVKGQAVKIKFGGQSTASIKWAPTAGGDDTVIKIAAGGTGLSRSSFFSLEGVRIYSDDTTLHKVAIDAYDASHFRLRDVYIGGEDQWLGAGTSIGIRTRGREFIDLDGVFVYANDGFPLQISNDPVTVGLDADYLRINQCVFSGDKTAGTTKPCIKVDANIQISRSLIQGVNCSFGGHAFYWSDPSSAISSDQFEIHNFSWEQPKCAAAAGWTIYIDRTGSSALANFEASHILCGGGGLENGIYLRGVLNISINHFEFTSTTGKVPWDIVAAHLMFTNLFIQSSAGSPVSTGMSKVLGVGRNASTAIISQTLEVWEFDANTNVDLSLVLWGVPVRQKAFTLADGATLAIPMIAGAMRVGKLSVFAKGSSQTIGGDAIVHAGGVMLLSAVGSGAGTLDDADTANNLCVVYVSAASVNLKNNTGQEMTGAFTFTFVQ